MNSDRKQPSVAFWATVALSLVLLYVASFGPACWINQRTGVGHDFVWIAYRPMWWMMCSRNKSLRRLVFRYAKFGAKDDGSVLTVFPNTFEWMRVRF